MIGTTEVVGIINEMNEIGVKSQVGVIRRMAINDELKGNKDF